MKPSLQLTAVTLRVASLARSLDFYGRQLGFVAVETSENRAVLTTAPGNSALLYLEEDRDAPPSDRNSAGLFHAALLFPSRGALGAWLRFAAEQRIEFDGFSDHGVSEAIYFSDPDGNGHEFYVDRPREQWPYENGMVAMKTEPLDVPSLLAAGEQAPNHIGVLAGTQWGHLHLRVTDLDRSEAFYREALGLKLTQGTYPGARFLAADGYHHHLGLNIWGRPRQPRSEKALGLSKATFSSADTSAGTLRDPDHIVIEVLPLSSS